MKKKKRRRTGNDRNTTVKSGGKYHKIRKDEKERILIEIIDKWRALFGQKNFETIIDEKILEKLAGDALEMWNSIRDSLKSLWPVRTFGNTKHHVLPGSRGGSNSKDNLISKIGLAHIAWHILFDNKTVTEIIDLLETGRKKKSSFLRSKKRLLAWLIVFGDNTSFQDAIIIIRSDWVKKIAE